MLRFVFVVFLALPSFPALAAADDCVLLSGGRIYASANNSAGFRLTVSKVRSEGELFAFDGSGAERRHWRAKLLAPPARVLVPDHGKLVVTLDMMCRAGYEHALVIYGDGGRVVADYSLEDLLTPEEISSHVTHTVSSRHWTRGAEFSFDYPRDRLRIRFPWGAARFLDLTTGRIVERDGPSPAESATWRKVECPRFRE